MSLFIGLDCGTQSTKCLVYNESKRAVVGRGQAPHTLIQDRPGQAEQQPSMWIEVSLTLSLASRGGSERIVQISIIYWDFVSSALQQQACKTAMQAALASCDKSKVKAISVSGQQHGLVALDANMQVIRPSKLWCDVESADEAQDLSHRFGFTLVPSFTATKVLWMKNNEPENFDRLAHVLLPHDYINWYFTGRLAMEPSDASGTGVYDTASKTWDRQGMESIDTKLPSCFPELIGANDALGTLLPDIAQQLGLPDGVIVGPGGGDNAMSALGCGAVRDGTWVLSLGTSGTLFGPASTPILDPTGTICPFCDATGKWLPLLCTLNCTAVVEEVG